MNEPYADLCNPCLAEGRYDTWPPVGIQSRSGGGGELVYRCDRGHEWTCAWAFDYGEPVPSDAPRTGSEPITNDPNRGDAA